jgi:hypothetical protein
LLGLDELLLNMNVNFINRPSCTLSSNSAPPDQPLLPFSRMTRQARGGEIQPNTRRPRGGAALVLITCGLLQALPASAANAGSYRLSLVRGEGAETCPTAAEVEASVNARLNRVAFSPAAGASIEGVFSREGAAWIAELWVRDETGRSTGSRRIPALGPDCAALAEAATLAIALTIDPDAALAEPGAPALRPLPALPAPPPRVPPCPLCPVAPVPRCPACQPSARTTGGLSFRASARVLAAAGALPGVAPGLGLHAEVGTETWSGFANVSYLPESRTSDRRFGFGLGAAGTGVCGSFHGEKAVVIGVCGGLELGGVHAVVYDLTPLEPGDRLWFAAAIGPRVRIPGPGATFFDLGLSGVVPLLRRNFRVRGVTEPAFEQSVFGGFGYLGVGFEAP